MSADVRMELTRPEAEHLATLIGQFDELLEGSTRTADDPAIRRLVPDAYAAQDDAREFRALTEGDLLDRRRTDAATALALLTEATATHSTRRSARVVTITLDQEAVQTFLRTLAALRLVLAVRLGVETEDDHDPADARFHVYDWLGYRLELLVESLQP